MFGCFRNSLYGGLTLITIILLGAAGQLRGQTKPPEITVTPQNDRNEISWSLDYRDIHSIGIQRSSDSVYNYSTVGYAKEPGLKQNTFSDKGFPFGKNFYRLYLELPGGKLVYSKAAGVVDTLRTVVGVIVPPPAPVPIIPETPVKIEAPKKSGPPPYAPSLYVYTDQDGDVNINLPDVMQGHYSLKFFDTTGAQVFNIPSIAKNFLIIDKSNFMHTGWFKFELDEDGKPKLNWKLYIPDPAQRSK